MTSCDIITVVTYCDTSIYSDWFIAQNWIAVAGDTKNSEDNATNVLQQLHAYYMSFLNPDFPQKKPEPIFEAA